MDARPEDPGNSDKASRNCRNGKEQILLILLN